MSPPILLNLAFFFLLSMAGAGLTSSWSSVSPRSTTRR